MKCEVCGWEYGVSDNCPGPIQRAPDLQNPPPSGFALWRYLGERWRVLPYGISIGVLAIPFLAIVYLRTKSVRALSPS